jgi:Tfp pilus assembly protein PilN
MVIGVLGALLLMVGGYVLTTNQINSRKSGISRAQKETAEAKQRAAALAPYARFAQIKATRLNSVRELAQGRFDWERMMRELALVLPTDVWLTDVSASTSPQSSDSGATGTPATPSTGATASGSVAGGTSPSLALTGCAKRQDDVATMMVRLRKLDRVTDVNLDESSKQDSSGGGGSAGTADSSPSASGSSQACPPKDYQFKLNVSFSAESSSGAARGVPARLGGGA